ncbi:MAG: TetR/AcrR family transcriptional regulator [Anditalea sp.]
MSTEKRNIILESTLELVKEHGFQGFPISEVAKRGGIAVGTIYHYFEGKDELIRELYYYVVDMIYQTALEKDDGSKSFKERYYDLWSNLVNLYCEKPSILRFFDLYNNSSYYSPEAHTEESKFYKWLFGFFAEGLQSGSLRSISKELLAIIVLGNILTSAKVKINHSFKFKNKNIDLGQLAGIVWEGIKSQDNDHKDKSPLI